MPSLRYYDLFISHAWTYGDDYYRLIKLLDGAPNFSWRNFSVPEHDPLHGGTASRLRASLREQMRRVHVVLALSGVYATHSEWMQEEFGIADEYLKPAIGLLPWGSQRASTAVQDVAGVCEEEHHGTGGRQVGQQERCPVLRDLPAKLHPQGSRVRNHRQDPTNEAELEVLLWEFWKEERWYERFACQTYALGRVLVGKRQPCLPDGRYGSGRAFAD
jgi:hypothetical protein